MSDETPLLSLPLILPAQAQKHVTHNEALRLLDILLHLAVLDRTRTEAPALPTEGDRHIIASPASGAWTGQDGKVAAFWGGVWVFLAPRPGWQARVLDEEVTLIWSGSAWQDEFALPEILPKLGLSTPADATNRLALRSPASLFTHDGGSHRMTVNKSAPDETASLSLQSGFVSHAEFGLLGNNSATLQVSADGSSFTPALAADPATARVTLFRPVILDGQAGDPASPAEGTLWHNAATAQLGLRLGGQTLRLDGQQDIPWLAPPAGDLVLTTTGTGGAATGTAAGAAGRFDLFPFLPRADLAIDRMLVNCTTALAGALARISVYSADAQGRPAALLVETADLDLSTTGAKAATVALSLRQGRTYWLGLRHSSTATLSTWATAATPDINGGSTPVTTARKVLRRTLAFTSAAPASWGFAASEINAASAPAIWMRVI